ncbi:MAG: sulfur carrier protein ThiS [Muribaculaceae bacterium]|nr:sulfur carrier protein ThiS [Muribaculaceae bacterium]
MQIFINREAVEVNPNDTLAEILESQNIVLRGIAVAVNNKVVPRTSWESITVAEGDSVTVISAVCGG